MKRITLIAAAAAVALLMTACSGGAKRNFDFTMPDSPTEFISSTVPDPNDDSMNFAALEFDGKLYVSYGTIEEDPAQSEVGACLGYLVQDGNKLKEIGVFPLTSDPDQNYLICMDEAGNLQNISVFRNSETAGKDITTPSFIKSREYSYWK